MRNRKYSLSLLFLLTVPQLYASKSLRGIDTVFGDWKVVNVICSNCGERIPEEKGIVIKFRQDQIINPLSESCRDELSYNLLKELPGKQAISDFGRPWPLAVRNTVDRQSKVFYGFITCRGMNLMQILFVSDERAFYFFEGEIVFDLRHLR